MTLLRLPDGGAIETRSDRRWHLVALTVEAGPILVGSRDEWPRIRSKAVRTRREFPAQPLVIVDADKGTWTPFDGTAVTG